MAQMLVIYQAMEDVKHQRADYLSTSMEEMRLKFMTFGGQTLMGWVHGLKAYELKLAETKTAGDIVWSDVLWKEFLCTMSNFRGFVRTMVQYPLRTRHLVLPSGWFRILGYPLQPRIPYRHPLRLRLLFHFPPRILLQIQLLRPLLLCKNP
jgi:hypothetical protein